jgi:hypothetical protein
MVERPKRKFGSKRGLEKPLTDWAAAQAREALGTDPAAEAYAKMLARLAKSARERGERLAFSWFPKPGGLPAAQLSVATFSGSGGELTLDKLEEEFGWRDDQTRTLEIGQAGLPAGEAIRVRREQADGDGASSEDETAGSGSPDVAVSVTYAILAPELDDALVYTMFWLLADDDPALADLADMTAWSLRVTV